MSKYEIKPNFTLLTNRKNKLFTHGGFWILRFMTLFPINVLLEKKSGSERFQHTGPELESLVCKNLYVKAAEVMISGSEYVENISSTLSTFKGDIGEKRVYLACRVEQLGVYESLWLKHGLDSLIRMSEWNILSLNMQQLSEISNK